jgi:hypothetical protein
MSIAAVSQTLATTHSISAQPALRRIKGLWAFVHPLLLRADRLNPTPLRLTINPLVKRLPCAMLLGTGPRSLVESTDSASSSQ